MRKSGHSYQPVLNQNAFSAIILTKVNRYLPAGQTAPIISNTNYDTSNLIQSVLTLVFSIAAFGMGIHALSESNTYLSKTKPIVVGSSFGSSSASLLSLPASSDAPRPSLRIGAVPGWMGPRATNDRRMSEQSSDPNAESGSGSGEAGSGSGEGVSGSGDPHALSPFFVIQSGLQILLTLMHVHHDAPSMCQTSMVSRTTVTLDGFGKLLIDTTECTMSVVHSTFVDYVSHAFKIVNIENADGWIATPSVLQTITNLVPVSSQIVTLARGSDAGNVVSGGLNVGTWQLSSSISLLQQPVNSIFVKNDEASSRFLYVLDWSNLLASEESTLYVMARPVLENVVRGRAILSRNPCNDASSHYLATSLYGTYLGVGSSVETLDTVFDWVTYNVPKDSPFVPEFTSVVHSGLQPLSACEAFVQLVLEGIAHDDTTSRRSR